MTEFYYIDDVSKQQCGPFAPNLLRQKGVTAATMVWRTGMADWVQAGTVAELQHLFNPNAAAPAGNTASQTSPQPQQNQYSNTNNQQYNNGQQQNRGYNQNAGGNRQNQNRFDVRPLPKNYLVESILVTLFCCLPMGIAGIVNATKVESLYAMGDYESAEQAAADAKKWCKYALISGIVVYGLYILFSVFVGVASYATR